MKLDISKNAGFCYGVKRALKIVEKAYNDEAIPKPIYIYGEIIHNKHVVNDLTQNGIITLPRDPNLFKTISGTIIFSAHGISEELKDEARKANLNVIDATCNDVLKTFNVMDENPNLPILYLGIPGHAEAEAALSHKNCHLITSKEDIDKFSEECILVSQTTLSKLEIADLISYALTKPNIKVQDILCHTTTIRQEEVLEADGYDLIYVVGDKLSNNSKSLARLRDNTILIETYLDINPSDLDRADNILVTAGASTPEYLITEVANYIKKYKKIL